MVVRRNLHVELPFPLSHPPFPPLGKAQRSCSRAASFFPHHSGIGGAGLRLRRTVAATGLALLMATSVLSAEEIRIIESRPLAPDARTADISHEFRLFICVFEGGRWEPALAARAALEAAGLLRRCGVALSHAELRVVEAPSRFRHYFTPASRELLQRLRAFKPAILFVDDTLNDPAYDAKRSGARTPRLVQSSPTPSGLRTGHATCRERSRTSWFTNLRTAASIVGTPAT